MKIVYLMNIKTGGILSLLALRKTSKKYIKIKEKNE